MVIFSEVVTEKIEYGNSETVDDITVVPLRIKSGFNGKTLVDATTSKIAEILESESVNVLRLKLKKASSPILLPFLQVVSGGKQDRMLIRPMVIPAAKTSGIEHSIPVNCIERGRWTYSRQSTGENTTAQFTALSGVRMAQSIGAMNLEASQGVTWSSISSYIKGRGLDSLVAPSESFIEAEAAVQDVSKRVEKKEKKSALTEAARALIERSDRLMEGQTGLALIIQGVLIGIELYGSSEIWKSQATPVKQSFLSEVDLSSISKEEQRTGVSGLEAVLKGLKSIDFVQKDDNQFGKYFVDKVNAEYSSLALQYQGALAEFYLGRKSKDFVKIMQDADYAVQNVVQRASTTETGEESEIEQRQEFH